MQEQSTIDVSGEVSDPGAGLAAESSSVQDTGSTSSQDVNTGLSQEQPSQQTAPPEGQQEAPAEELDPLAGLPPMEELQRAVEQKIPYAEGLLNLRQAFENLKATTSTELSRFQPLESFADRFTTPEEAQRVLEVHDALYGWAPDPVSGELVPTTNKLVEMLPPKVAEFLTADLIEGEVQLPDGRMASRLDVILNTLGKDRILEHFGIDASQAVAPSWAPSEEELEKVKPEYHELYKKLPYEDRQELKLNSPEFINNALRKEKLIQETERDRTERAEQIQQAREQEERQTEQLAVQAGNQYIDQQIQQGFQGLYSSICDKWQPTDDPGINKMAGALVAGLVVTLSHAETRPVVEKTLKEVGLLDEKGIQTFDAARNGFVGNAYNFGYLQHKSSKGQQNGQADPSVSMLQSQANKSFAVLQARAQAMATQVISRLNKLFVGQANTHNRILDQAVPARPPINGNPVNPATMPGQPAIAGSQPFSDESVSRFVRR